MDAAMRWLAADTPSRFGTVRLLDGTKIICGMSRQTTQRSDLFGWCGYGYDRSHSLYYWGASPPDRGGVYSRAMIFAGPQE